MHIYIFFFFFLLLYTHEFKTNTHELVPLKRHEFVMAQLPRLRWLDASPLVRQLHMLFMNSSVMVQAPRYLYLADGGVVEDLGLVVLLQRKRRWILSIDAGDDTHCDRL